MKLSGRLKKKLLLINFIVAALVFSIIALNKVVMHNITELSNVDTAEYNSVNLSASNEVYINSVEDFVAFRNNVNNGTTYSGYKIILTTDLDLSSVCSPTLGSWVPIGKSTCNNDFSIETGDGCFQGVFDGNYHTIRNLYINSDLIQIAGLFGIVSEAEIKNLILIDVNINNTYSIANKYTWAGGIVGAAIKNSKISNCGIENRRYKNRESSNTG